MNAMLEELEETETIVEYDAATAPYDGYPERIVSPPSSGPCCLSEMCVLGEIHVGSTGSYVYKRCKVCGFAVRRFLTASQPAIEEDLDSNDWGWTSAAAS